MRGPVPVPELGDLRQGLDSLSTSFVRKSLASENTEPAGLAQARPLSTLAWIGPGQCRVTPVRAGSGGLRVGHPL